MKVKKILLSIIMGLFLVSCSNGGDCYNSHRKIVEMKSYTSDVNITVHGNRSISKYKTKQTFLDPHFIKMETIEPKELLGKKVVYNGDKWKVYHPLIKDVVEFDALRDIDEVMYMGIIHKKFLMSEDLKEKSTEKYGQKCIEFSGNLPNSNDHRKYARLYISEKTLVPIALEICNRDNKVTLEVKYNNFKYNPTINKDEFKLNK